MVRMVGGLRDARSNWATRYANDRLHRLGLLHPTVTVPYGSRLTSSCYIDAYTTFSGPFIVRGSGSFQMGRYCAVGDELRVVTTNHEMHHVTTSFRPAKVIGMDLPIEQADPIRIGNDVWVGDRVTFLPGVTVGDGAVIGAGSVVTRDIPAYAAAAGVPCRVLKRRHSEEMVAALRSVAWWNWSDDEIIANRAFFELDLRTAEPAEVQAFGPARQPEPQA